MRELQVQVGNAIKALDDDGRVGAYGVLFGGKDLYKTYFTNETYFGARKGDGCDVVFHHMMPVIKGLEGLADKFFAPCKAVVDEVGVFVEHVLNMADEYEAAVFGLVKAGKLGWSSGAPGHMVRCADDGQLTCWPIAEFSYTPTPAEPRNRMYNAIQPVKSLVDPETIRPFEDFLRDIVMPGEPGSPFNNVDRVVLGAALDEVNWALRESIWDAVYAKDQPKAERMEIMRTCFDACRDKSLQFFQKLVDEPELAEGLKSRELWGIRTDANRARLITTERDFEEFLRDAGFPKSAATSITSHGFSSLRRRESEEVDRNRATMRVRELESLFLTGVA